MSISLKKDHSISTIIGVAFMLVLVTILAAVIFAMIMGLPQNIAKSALVATTTDLSTTEYANGLLTILPRAGDPFYLAGQKKKNGSEIYINVVRADNSQIWNNVAPDPDIIDAGSLYGRTIYIYQLYNCQRPDGQCCTNMTTDHTKLSKMTFYPFWPAEYRIELIDNYTHVMIGNQPVNTKQLKLRPANAIFNMCNGGYSGAWGSTPCHPLVPHYPSSEPSVTTLTCSNGNTLCARQFDGSQHINYDQYTDFNITSDFSLSVHINPTSLSSGHQIFGKGKSDTDDNYDFYTIENQLYFEWVDKDSGQMYHIMTDSPTLQTNQWTYVNVVLENGIPKIYKDGQEYSVQNGNLKFYLGDNPWDGSAPITPIPVKLRDNDNPVFIGQQDYPGFPYNFQGQISDIAIYDRALSNSDIQNNRNSCRV